MVSEQTSGNNVHVFGGLAARVNLIFFQQQQQQQQPKKAPLCLQFIENISSSQINW